jgi:hypothetical protein
MSRRRAPGLRARDTSTTSRACEKRFAIYEADPVHGDVHVDEVDVSRRCEVWVGRVVAVTLALASVLSACRPLPPERDRFLGIRRGPPGTRFEIVFGRCGDERVMDVLLRYADPPDEVPHDGVLWRIESDGSTRTRFVVGDTPDGFREVVPYRVERLPSPFVVIGVVTDDEMTTLTSKSFRPENLRTDLYISSWGPTEADAIDDESRKGCVPHHPAYA